MPEVEKTQEKDTWRFATSQFPDSLVALQPSLHQFLLFSAFQDIISLVADKGAQKAGCGCTSVIVVLRMLRQEDCKIGTKLYYNKNKNL